MKDFLEALIEEGQKQIAASDDPGRKYLLKLRGVLPEQITEYKLGTVSLTALTSIAKETLQDKKPGLVKSLKELLMELGLAIIFPIYSARKKVQGFSLRTLQTKDYRTILDDSTEYEPYFWNLDNVIENVWRGEPLFITEGVLNALTFKRLYPNVSVVASTSKSIVRIQAKFIKRFVKHVVLLFDKDVKKNVVPILDVFTEVLDWGRSGGIDLRKINDLNDLLVTQGEFRTKRFLENQLLVLRK